MLLVPHSSLILFRGETKKKRQKSALWRHEFFKRCWAALPSADMWKLRISSASFPVQTNWPWPILCAAGSDAVTETDKLKWQPYWGDRAMLSLVHRSQPLTVTAAWGRLYDGCIDPCPQKHSAFDILPMWSVYSLRYGARRIVFFYPEIHKNGRLPVYFVWCVHKTLLMHRLTPASFCCKMVWSWPPSDTDQRQLLPWLASHYLEERTAQIIYSSSALEVKIVLIKTYEVD